MICYTIFQTYVRLLHICYYILSLSTVALQPEDFTFAFFVLIFLPSVSVKYELGGYIRICPTAHMPVYKG